jgi:hypothetical protein
MKKADKGHDPAVGHLPAEGLSRMVLPVVAAQCRRHGFHNGHRENPLVRKVFADPGLQHTLPSQDDSQLGWRQMAQQSE